MGIETLFMIAGTAVSAMGQMAGADAMRQNGIAERKYAEAQAKQMRAQGTYEMDDRYNQYLAKDSQRRAMEAAGGGGFTPELSTAMHSEAKYQGQRVYANSETNARMKEHEGKIKETAANNQAAAAEMGAFGSLLSGTSKAFGGGGAASWMKFA